ncbi:hypothetical protein GWK47_049761 [Chionoecetes opilio]|uniref:Uncharacterized protein n=1 Tax=Chionoecetes opilio TaxID=41210 RepID=A0A8J5CEV9_CHIOP|nr:hypothetical protein GWK47_049761 [Chionoecetes opilio]
MSLTVTPHGRAPACTVQAACWRAAAVSLGLLHPNADGGSGSPHSPVAEAAGRVYLSVAIHPPPKVEQERWQSHWVAERTQDGAQTHKTRARSPGRARRVMKQQCSRSFDIGEGPVPPPSLYSSPPKPPAQPSRIPPPQVSFTPTSKAAPPLLQKQLALEHIAAVSSSFLPLPISTSMVPYSQMGARGALSTHSTWRHRREAGLAADYPTCPALPTASYRDSCWLSVSSVKGV